MNIEHFPTQLKGTTICLTKPSSRLTSFHFRAYNICKRRSARASRDLYEICFYYSYERTLPLVIFCFVKNSRLINTVSRKTHEIMERHDCQVKDTVLCMYIYMYIYTSSVHLGQFARSISFCASENRGGGIIQMSNIYCFYFWMSPDV